MATGKVYRDDYDPGELKERAEVLGIDVNGDGSRASKYDPGVDYSDEGTPTCATCLHFVPQTAHFGTCMKVEGVIAAKGTSSLHRPRGGA